jgi:hypothetical protein
LPRRASPCSASGSSWSASPTGAGAPIPCRHRYDLHVALHFLLPGATGLAAVLAGGEPLFWRVAALLAAVAGLVESLGFLAAPGFPQALPGRALRALDPLLYVLVGVAAVASPPLGLVPMQIEGMATGLVFLAGNGLPVARLRRTPGRPCPHPPVYPTASEE